MIRSTLLALAALAIATAPAMAATSTTTHAATRAVPAKPTTPAKQVAVVTKRATPAVPARTASAAKPRSHAGMVTTTLSNGKKVTYDCHLAGNKTKSACKGVG